MNHIIESLRAEYLRYKGLAEAAIGQLSEAELVAAGAGGGNSIAVICWHLGGTSGRGSRTSSRPMARSHGANATRNSSAAPSPAPSS